MSEQGDSLDRLFNAVVAVAALAMKVYTVVVLWRWFVVPFGLPPLHSISAFGLLMLTSVVRYRYQKLDQDITERIGASLSLIASCAVALAMGWIALKMGA